MPLTFEEQEKVKEITSLLKTFPETSSITAIVDNQRTGVRIANEFRKSGHSCLNYGDAGEWRIQINQKK